MRVIREESLRLCETPTFNGQGEKEKLAKETERIIKEIGRNPGNMRSRKKYVKKKGVVNYVIKSDED